MKIIGMVRRPRFSNLNPDADCCGQIFDGNWHRLRAVIGLSTGCSTMTFRYQLAWELESGVSECFEDVSRESRAGAVIVSALEMNGDSALPGSLEG